MNREEKITMTAMTMGMMHLTTEDLAFVSGVKGMRLFSKKETSESEKSMNELESHLSNGKNKKNQ